MSSRKIHFTRFKNARGPFCFDGFNRWTSSPPLMSQDIQKVTCKNCLGKFKDYYGVKDGQGG